MSQHVEYLRYIEDQCLRCHSCKCFHSTSKIGSVCFGELATYLLNDEIDEYKSSVLGCHQCGRCLRKCPKKFDTKEFMYHARGYIESKKQEICTCYSLVRVDLNDNMFAKQKEELGVSYDDALEMDEACERLFVPGCHMASGFSDLTKNVTNQLKKWNIADGVTAKCCGNPLYASGHFKEFISYVEKMDEIYKKHGVKEIVTPCPSCYDFNLRMKKEGYLKGVEIKCLSQELVNKGIKIKRFSFPEDYKVTIHDSCPDRKRGIFSQSIRELYTDFDVIEMDSTRENTLCCGNGGLVPLYSKFISNEGKELKTKEFEKTKSDCMITTCFNCYKGLNPNLPIHQYLQDLMEEQV